MTSHAGVRPAGRVGRGAAMHAAVVLGGSALLAAAAQVSLPMWPVPMSMQSFAVLLIGLSAGARLGAGAVLAYLVEAAFGLPVLAGGHALLPLAPSSGYLIGFVLAAGATGFLADRGWTRDAVTLAIALAAGTALIYLPGLLWLGVFLRHGVHSTVTMGLLPFFAGDIAKALLAGLASGRGGNLVRRLCAR